MYQGSTPKILNRMPTLMAIATIAACNFASAGASMVFNYQSGFASAGGAIRGAWASSIVGSAINLTSTGVQHKAGGAWYTTQQNISAFTTDFTFQISPSGNMPSIQG